jgi:hypothetical protein
MCPYRAFEMGHDGSRLRRESKVRSGQARGFALSGEALTAYRGKIKRVSRGVAVSL